MKKTNFRIDMDLVRKIIKDKGFYFIKAERLFDDHYSGPAFYIVTDNPEFKCNDSRFADAVILTTTQFEPIAEIVNEELKQNDKDKGNAYADTTIIVPITSRMKNDIPNHVIMHYGTEELFYGYLTH